MIKQKDLQMSTKPVSCDEPLKLAYKKDDYYGLLGINGQMRPRPFAS
ncbi:hypothetical protein [Paenisporosarcina sp. OV554]|nr:hypothetical protein [Paenisporosarcina sp. OV554]PUB08226.1 hypothetical protein C8K15_1395 [Paenisporosarcina sp. OV554]